MLQKTVTFILRTISLLPFRILYALSDLIYPIVKLLYRRQVVRENLVTSFPEKDLKEIKQIERKFYHYFCDLLFETIKQVSMPREEMMRRMKMTGMESIEQGFSAGKTSLFYYLGHYANWEWMSSMQYWTPYCHCAQIYHPLYNKVLDDVFLKIRERYGGECIPMKVAPRTLVKYKNDGTKVLCGFISDQQPKWENIHYFTRFLNHDTAVFTGGEQMGKKFNAMMYYGRIRRPKRGYYECESVQMFFDSEKIPDYEVTDRYMQLLEEDINAHPELWLWTHKRWSRTKEEWLKRQAQESV